MKCCAFPGYGARLFWRTNQIIDLLCSVPLGLGKPLVYQPRKPLHLVGLRPPLTVRLRLTVVCSGKVGISSKFRRKPPRGRKTERANTVRPLRLRLGSEIPQSGMNAVAIVLLCNAMADDACRWFSNLYQRTSVLRYLLNVFFGESARGGFLFRKRNPPLAI